ncbi:MAG: serine O-acetyltransferase [Acidimicrobiia bacterium]|nr:serine O-acetyltransferase [Acidimicrobiia bacterium]
MPELKAPDRPHPLRRLAEDVRTVKQRDPAARSTLEVLFFYPGLHALLFHRLAHRLWQAKQRFLARALSHLGRALTGIEIHPGAIIGRRLFIDHGMGTVIGETAEIGDDVTLYQGVTLGGTSLQRVKRHPTLMDGVIVGAGAIILGALTVGEKARVGAGAVVVRDVPAGATVVGLAGRVIDRATAPHPAMDLAESKGDHAVAVLEVLIDRVAELEGRINGSKTPCPPADEAHSDGSGI